MCVFHRELTELRKANALTQSAAQVAALSAEKTAKEELCEQILKQQSEEQTLASIMYNVPFMQDIFTYTLIIQN